MKRRFVRCALVAAFALFAGAGFARAETVIMRGGAIYTLDPAHPWATAVVIENGRIVYVGDDRGTQPYVRAGAHVVALAGRMVLPGFHDAHSHPMSAGMRLLRCKLGGLGTPDAVYDAIRTCAAHDRHAWFLGVGWSRDVFGASGPSRAKLDALVPDRPAYLTTEDGATAWVNAKALAAAGLDPARWPGAIADVTMETVHAKIPPPTEAEYRAALRLTMAMANRAGITSIFDARVSPAMADAYHDADVASELTVRVMGAQFVDPDAGPAQVDGLVAVRDRVRGPRFRADAAKIFLDDEIPFHTATMLAPYADRPGERGPAIPQDALNAIVVRLDAEGFTIHMHVMGDGAVRAGLDAIAAAMRANGARDRRHQLAHVGVADPADIPRFGAMGVGANFTPGWYPADDPVAASSDAALGPARARWQMPIASIAAHGGVVTAGSDWAATPMDPLDGIQWAVTHQPLDGHLPPRLPEERVSLAASVAAYTKNAAWAAREDAVDGTIEAGKAADLVVLDRNIFAMSVGDIHNARVLLTLLDGEPVYRDPAFTWR